MRRLVTNVTIVTVGGLLLLACGDGDGDPTIAPSVTDAGATGAPTTMTPAPATADPATVPADEPPLAVYFMLDGALAPVPRSVGALDARTALEAMLTGPSADDAAAGYHTEVPDGTELLDVSFDERLATVDLSNEFTTTGGSLSMQARVAQVVYTVTQFGDADLVQFAIDGELITDFGASVGLRLDAVGRLDIPDVLPYLMVEHPLAGQTVADPIVVSGVANVFEATVSIQVIAGDGSVVLDEFTTATAGSGEWGRFEHALAPLPAGVSGPLVIHVFESSPDTGAAVNVVDVPIEV